MKGWELYAWRDGEAWQFSLLVGTNREKADEEVVDPKMRLADVGAVKVRLSELREGEWVILLPRGRRGPLPPEQLREDLQAFCDARHLHLQ